MHHLSGQQTNKQLQQNNITVSCIPTSPLAHHNYTWPSPNANEMIISPTSGHIQSSPHQQQQQQQQHSPTSTIIKHARCSPRPSQSTAPYPSPTYGNHYNHHHHQQNHHNNSYNSSGNSSNGSSCNNSPIIHSNKINNSANNVFHQLSQQNVTITPHSNQLQQQPQQQQQQQQVQQPQQQTQLSAITITPNFVSHTQSPQQQQQQQQQQQRQQNTTTNTTTTTNSTTNLTANNNIVGNTNVSQQHVAVQHAVAVGKHTPNSPNRRTRGENKKCRKVYGMERRDEWCTQCKWKKACTRFGD